MPAFSSESGALQVPSAPHGPDPKYQPIDKGKPVCVEILHLAFGNVKDWWGKSEILVSSWAKTGGTAKPGPRLLNLMRKGIQQYDHISDFGAQDYGHRLIFYSPSYTGEELRFSLEFLEIDKLKPSEIASLGSALRGLGALPIFAPQLPFLALAPHAVELAGRLYNLFNRNDTVLLEHLDLAFNEPDSNVLSSGRYALVGGSHVPDTFISKYKLAADNRLVDTAGKTAEQAGLTDPYIVIRINAVEKNEYKDFQLDAAAQETLDAVLNHGLTKDIAEMISGNVKAARQFDTVKNILALKRTMEQTTDAAQRTSLRKEIEDRLKLLEESQAQTVREALTLKPLAAPGNP